MYEEEQKEVLTLPVWPILRGRLWHATSETRAASIFRDGVIRLGEEGVGYPNGHCRMNGSISLFDFSGRLEDVASQWINWRGWFGLHSHIEGNASVWLRIDRAAVAGNVQTPQDCLTDWYAASNRGNHMPHVEVCHSGPIPISDINGALVVCPTDGSRFQQFEAGPHMIENIVGYAETFPYRPPRPRDIASLLEGMSDEEFTARLPPPDNGTHR
jgi:hypothetical protein